MPSKNLFSKLVEKTRQQLMNVMNDPSTLNSSLKDVSHNIRMMQAKLKCHHTVSEKQHITSSLCLLQSFRGQMKALKCVGKRNYIGGGMKTTYPNLEWQDVESAFASRIKTGCIINLVHKDPTNFLTEATGLFEKKILSILKNEFSVKVNATFCGEFKITKQNEDFFEFKYMKTKNAVIDRNTIISSWCKKHIIDQILNELEEFQERDSGWALAAIVNLTFNINKFTSMLGSSYIELPSVIKFKRACVNVQNQDYACFAWSVISAIYPSKLHAERISSYPHYSNVLNMDGIKMPMTIKQIPRFELQNEISINVYILEAKNFNSFVTSPAYLSKNKMKKHVNLLLIQDNYDEDDGPAPKYHYVWIKNLSRLVSNQLNKHNGATYICDRCLHYFYSQKKLEDHTDICCKLNNCKVSYPTGDKAKVVFKNYKNKELVPFTIYADLECMLQPISGNCCGDYQKHVPYSIAYYVKCSYDDSLSFFKSYRGEDCQQWFVKEMRQFAENVETVFLCPLPMNPLSIKEEEEFKSHLNCHVCNQPFNEKDVRVRDHCHLTGRYRGPAHVGCNINFKDSHVIPIIFHNLSGYDSHFIIKNLMKDFEGKMDILPINKERYISFTKHVKENLVKFRFIDSFRFLASGLETLASYLTEYPNLKSEFPNLNYLEFKLLTRKGVFPYDYISDWTKLDEAKLPDVSHFYNKLNEENISNEEYTHALNVMETFHCKNLGEYSDLYLKTDVLLLADIFEQFRSSCLCTYGLDPAHYYTLPGFTWDCMLKHTKITLELLQDVDMILFIERGIRGGLSQCSKRYAKANNKYMPDYDPSKPTTFLIYDDINNQYGWAMSQHLPYGGFEWVKDVENCNWNISEDNPEGYILEVDLEYPETIHDIHSDLPFCPHPGTPDDVKLMKKTTPKLLATLENKHKYIIHYRNLQQCLANGLKLKKIHRILKFRQSPWLKSYINLNTKLRQNAANDFEKNLFKLMNNAVFGKTMENIRKYSIVKLVTKWEGRYGAEALISKPNFKSSTIFEENLVAIELSKTENNFNKPMYVGMCILDISKLKLYDFHYSYMKNRFGDKAKICYTDTDSLIYEVETPDLYNTIRQDAVKMFDTSDYVENNIYKIPRVNKKVIGLMKDENAGKVMTEFVGLRSKMYAVRVEGKDMAKKIKGVKKCIVKNRIIFQDYISCLQQKKVAIIKQNLIKCRNHAVTSFQQSKVALNPNDDKRFICPDGINTLPWGHYSINDITSS